MKTIILVRHGKSSWEYGVSDKDRPLKERGINDAHLVSRKFKEENVAIDYVYSSPANRALHTAVIFLRNLEYGFHKFEIKNDLYDFSGESLKSFVSHIDNNIKTVMIFGHNYAFTTMVNEWGDKYIENVSTSGLVQIQFAEKKWDQISKGITKTILFPKQLK